MGGDRTAGAQEKRGGRREKRGREARFLRWWEPGEIEKNFATFCLACVQPSCSPKENRVGIVPYPIFLGERDGCTQATFCYILLP